MKTILLLRHAKAEGRHSSKPDFERKLNQRGRTDAAALGEMLASQHQQADLIISSSAARCRQTAGIVARAIGVKASCQSFSKQLYEVSPAKWIKRLHKLPETAATAMLVGHNPDCEELVRTLTGSGVGMRTCALAVLRHDGSWKDVAAGNCSLTGTILPDKPAAAAAVAPQNREISWMAFNERVLQEAENDAVPPLDRLMFLSIVSSNLDEFYRVRVGSLEHAIAQHAGQPERQKSLTMLSEAVSHRAVLLQAKIEQTFKIILRLLARRHRLALIVEAEMSKAEREFCRSHCAERVRPNMTILTSLENKAIGAAIETDAIYLAVSMRAGRRPIARALIKIPRVVPRFIELPRASKRTSMLRIAWLDDVIRVSLPDIFSEFGYDRFEAHTIKMTRSAALDTDQEILSNYVDSFADRLKQRDSGQFVRVIHDEDMPRPTLQMLLKNFPLARHCNVIAAGRYHNLKDMSRFPRPPGRAKLAGSRHSPVPHYGLSPARSLIKAITAGDQLLHFPYHSFTWLLKILRAASIDPQVEGINISIYRLAPNSQIASALINAKNNGKKVVVVMELKARFDERHNIRWARLFEEAGIQVNYGLTGYKTHAKMILVRRRGDSPDLAMIGTGNFNEKTADFYGDMCLITANPKITSEVRKVFGLLLDPARIPHFHHLLVAPRDMRDRIVKFINAESACAREGKPARIRLKLNNLVDPLLIQHLEHAARSGVQIDLLIRGICAINPELPDFAGRIRAVSIIDRLLEHSRILVFENNGDPKAYIGSADFMQRNFNRRVEVYTPVFDEKLRAEIMHILDLHMSDNVKARILNAAQDNRLVAQGRPAIRSQAAILAYYLKRSKN